MINFFFFLYKGNQCLDSPPHSSHIWVIFLTYIDGDKGQSEVKLRRPLVDPCYIRIQKFLSLDLSLSTSAVKYSYA